MANCSAWCYCSNTIITRAGKKESPTPIHLFRLFLKQVCSLYDRHPRKVRGQGRMPPDDGTSGNILSLPLSAKLGLQVDGTSAGVPLTCRLLRAREGGMRKGKNR